MLEAIQGVKKAACVFAGVHLFLARVCVCVYVKVCMNVLVYLCWMTVYSSQRVYDLLIKRTHLFR